MLQDCSEKFIKAKGLFVHGKWFCKEECSEKDPETQEIKNLYDKGIEFANDKNEDDLYDEDEEEVEIEL
jgi:hypothetical protein